MVRVEDYAGSQTMLHGVAPRSPFRRCAARSGALCRIASIGGNFGDASHGKWRSYSWIPPHSSSESTSKSRIPRGSHVGHFFASALLSLAMWRRSKLRKSAKARTARCQRDSAEARRRSKSASCEWQCSRTLASIAVTSSPSQQAVWRHVTRTSGSENQAKDRYPRSAPEPPMTHDRGRTRVQEEVLQHFTESCIEQRHLGSPQPPDFPLLVTDIGEVHPLDWPLREQISFFKARRIRLYSWHDSVMSNGAGEDLDVLDFCDCDGLGGQEPRQRRNRW